MVDVIAQKRLIMVTQHNLPGYFAPPFTQLDCNLAQAACSPQTNQFHMDDKLVLSCSWPSGG